ncbi:zinc finger protein 628-like [Myxocyprinus asiaticus]|uniref:zinc finger protein 628-like n=1 Tax=Myxocyprinus asiaticus TaxID=70543 RepID=UPI002221A1E4|nr:zinc finger protein 628-like [Myxocyprinus asiaticus]
MATVQSESEQQLDNKLTNGTPTGDNQELQSSSAAIVTFNAEVCARGSDAKGTTDYDVPSLPASENSSPHGPALPPRNKDASGMACYSTSATMDEPKMDVYVQNNSSESVSTESGEDFGAASENLHNENKGQETDKEEIVDKTIENLGSDSKLAIEEEHRLKKDEEEFTKEIEFSGKEMQGIETGDPNSMEKAKHNTEESRKDEEIEFSVEEMQGTEGEIEETEDPNSLEKVKQNTEERGRADEMETSTEAMQGMEGEIEERGHPDSLEKVKHNTVERGRADEMEPSTKAMQGMEGKIEETGDPNSMEKVKPNTEEREGADKMKPSTKAMEGETEETGDPNSMKKVKPITEERGEEDEFKGGGKRLVVKQRKSSLECNECGKKFTRRETFNLHRHFHMHQDEQASLTCKECGITFQHRSDLIKHRSTHKEESQTRFVSKVSRSKLLSKRMSNCKIYKKQRKFQCEHCGMRFCTMVRLRLHACEQYVEKPFRCPLCRKEFQYRVSINAHMQSHSLDCPYRCLECNKGFQSVATLHIHQRSHAVLKPYECPDCNMVFRHRFIMEDHRRRHAIEKPHQCKICVKSFKFSSVLQQHQYLHTGRKPYHCSYCGRKFAFAQNMRAHCRQHKKISHSARSEACVTNYNVSHDRDVGGLGKENTNHNVEQQRNCPLCPQMFCKAAELRAHMLIHEAEYERMSNGRRFDKVYSCRYCLLKFPTESSLQSHLQIHVTNTLGVNTSPISNQFKAVPEKKNRDEADIDSMSRVGGLGEQTEKKPFRCRDCGKCFRYRSVLELHMRIHSKGYQCHVCKKSFRFSSYLQQHSIIHTGKKPYKCPDCGKDFAFLHNMKTHQRLHQQKPFRCTQCRKGYSDESQLQRHMLSHTGEKPYKCHLCDKSFSLAYLLRDHLNTHTGERPHRCQECNKSFPWLSSLLVHQKIHMRKRQGPSHSYPMSVHSQRGRVNASGVRRGRGRPRLDRDNGRSVPLRQDPLPGQMPNLVPQQSHSFNAGSHQRMQLRSQHLQAQNHSQPIQLQQEWQFQITPPSDELLHSQSLLETQPTDVQMQWPGLPDLMHQQQTSRANVPVSAQPSLATNHYPEIKISGNDQEQKGKHPSLWVNTPNSPESPHHMDRTSSLDVTTQSPRSRSQSSPNQLLNVQDQKQSQWSVLCDSVQTRPQDDQVTMDLDAATSSESNKRPHVRKEDLQIQKSPGLGKMPILGQTDGMVLSTGVSSLQNANPWSLQTHLEMSTTVSLQEIPGDALEKQQNRIIHHLPQQMQVPHQLSQQMQVPQQLSQQMQVPQQLPQQMQVPHQQMQLQQQLLQQQLHQPQLQQQTQMPPSWVSATPSNQLGPLNMPYPSARFPLGERPPMWGFQTTPVLNGPVQQGHIPAQQHVALMSGRQIPLNQSTSFISPPFPPPPPSLNLPAPHPIHSVGRQLPGPLPQGIFFSSQGTINEMPLMPQVTNLPQLAQQTEPHKIVNKMPFAPDHLFHCMICGCSLPGELELQMHYMQHAQRDI